MVKPPFVLELCILYLVSVFFTVFQLDVFQLDLILVEKGIQKNSEGDRKMLDHSLLPWQSYPRDVTHQLHLAVFAMELLELDQVRENCSPQSSVHVVFERLVLVVVIWVVIRIPKLEHRLRQVAPFHMKAVDAIVDAVRTLEKHSTYATTPRPRCSRALEGSESKLSN